MSIPYGCFIDSNGCVPIDQEKAKDMQRIL